MRPDVSGPDAPKESRIMLKALGEAFTIITLNDVSSKVVSMDGIMINRSPGIGLNTAQNSEIYHQANLVWTNTPTSNAKE